MLTKITLYQLMGHSHFTQRVLLKNWNKFQKCYKQISRNFLVGYLCEKEEQKTNLFFTKHNVPKILNCCIFHCCGRSKRADEDNIPTNTKSQLCFLPFNEKSIFQVKGNWHQKIIPENLHLPMKKDNRLLIFSGRLFFTASANIRLPQVFMRFTPLQYLEFLLPCCYTS